MKHSKKTIPHVGLFKSRRTVSREVHLAIPANHQVLSNDQSSNPCFVLFKFSFCCLNLSVSSSKLRRLLSSKDYYALLRGRMDMDMWERFRSPAEKAMSTAEYIQHVFDQPPPWDRQRNAEIQVAPCMLDAECEVADFEAYGQVVHKTRGIGKIVNADTDGTN